MRDLWHAAGRAAGDRQKRRVAMLGVLWSAPVLVLGALLSHLLSAPATALEGIRAPLGYVLAPLRDAYIEDHDLALLGYVALQGLLLTMVWGVFGGALGRLAAVDLTQQRREETPAAFGFARRHWRGFVGAKAALFLGAMAPLAVAAGLAALGRLDGAFGSVLLAIASVGVVLLVFAGVFVGFCWAVAGFLTSPTIACEDSDAFDALSRTFGYAGAGLPRLTLARLALLGGVLIGALWRGVRVLVVVGLALPILRLGAGDGPVDRAYAILAAMGTPPDAARLGLTWGDYLLAFVLAVLLFVLLATWLADLISRCVCARTAVYLLARRRIDGVERATLRTAPAAPDFQDAEAAGFVEVARIGGSDA